MSAPRPLHVSLVVFVLAAIGTVGCARSDNDAALRVVLQLSPHLKANCIQLTVTGGDLRDDSEVRERGTQTTLTYAVYRGRFPSSVNLVGKGFVGAAGCAGALTLNEETAPLPVEFDRSRIGEATLTLDSAVVPFDADNDGYRSGEAEGPDCDDALPKVNPAATEDCADGKDNNCDGLTDCADAACPNRACATGTCQGAVCINGPVELNCANGLDDDSDGTVDCADVNCEARACAQDRCTTGLCTALSCRGSTPVVCDTPPTECHQAAQQCTLEQGCVYAVAVNNPCNGGEGSCSDTGVCRPLFQYAPSNFTPRPASEHSEKVILDCSTGGMTFIFNSTPGVANDGFVQWCESARRPAVSRVTLPNGQPAVLLSMRGLEVKNPWRIVGSQPVILSVIGDAEIHRMIDAGGDDNETGPGANVATYCGRGSTGGTAVDADDQVGPGAGGGGGGFATFGAGGGATAPAGVPAGAGGSPEQSSGMHLTVPRGGCNGGNGGAAIGIGPSSSNPTVPGGVGGFAGGALQISASGWMRILNVVVGFPGTVTVSGGGGEGGQALSTQVGSGGGGGGSGGSLILEANDLFVSGRITANGGSGGEGATNQTGSRGISGRRNFDSAQAVAGGAGGSDSGGNGGNGGALSVPPTSGQQGRDGIGGGGGGGGATGKIQVRIRLGCTRSKFTETAVLSPIASGCTF